MFRILNGTAACCLGLTELRRLSSFLLLAPKLPLRSFLYNLRLLLCDKLFLWRHLAVLIVKNLQVGVHGSCKVEVVMLNRGESAP